MSFQATPTLLELAAQSLLRDEALTISALEDLPGELLPRLFKAAFESRQTNVLKAMVQTWPFPCLPLGALMKTETPQDKSIPTETLQAILEGLDLLLAEQPLSRRCKLQVLDFRSEHQNFWKVWAGNTAEISAEAKSKQAQQTSPRMVAKQPLQVSVDVHLRQGVLDPFFNLYRWAEEKKGLLQLSCKKLKITTGVIQDITKVLEVLDLAWMQELEVHCTWKLSTLADFAPYLGQMRNLRKFLLCNIQVPLCISLRERKQFITQFTSQFHNLGCLQELSMDSAYFLQGRLDQVLRCLNTPLETLAFTESRLLKSDLTSLSRRPSVHQLKHLSFSGVQLCNFPELLQDLLERLTATLQTLDLEGCRIKDAQLSALVPILSHCDQLTTFNFMTNPISVAGLENLLRHTARMSRLSLEMYSAPWEMYGPQSAEHYRRLEQLRNELRTVWIKNSKTVWFSAIPCVH